jgi:hypothetical protein
MVTGEAPIVLKTPPPAASWNARADEKSALLVKVSVPAGRRVAQRHAASGRAERRVCRHGNRAAARDRGPAAVGVGAAQRQRARAELDQRAGAAHGARIRPVGVLAEHDLRVVLNPPCRLAVVPISDPPETMVPPE